MSFKFRTVIQKLPDIWRADPECCEQYKMAKRPSINVKEIICKDSKKCLYIQ